MAREILNLGDFKRYIKKDKSISSRINWEENIGLVVKILYFDEIYEVKIVDYKNPKVIYEYNGEVQKPMFSGHFMECKFGNIFKEAKYMRDDITNTYFTIDYDKTFHEFDLSKEVIDNLTIGSKQKLFFKCRKCNITKPYPSEFGNIKRSSTKCVFCSSGASYPERLFAQLFKELGVDYTKTGFNWSNGRIYDAYFKNISLCVELHGQQHYTKSFYTLGGKTVSEEQANDRYKKFLAKKNGIKNYIQIDCRESNIQYIKSNIVKSLSWAFDFSNVDWVKIGRNCEDSLIYEVCELWNSSENEIESIKFLTKKLNISLDTVRAYLKKGAKLGWCNYNPSEEIIKNAIRTNKLKGKKVLCVEKGIIYDSVAEAERQTGIANSNISKCARGKKGFLSSGGYGWVYVN